MWVFLILSLGHLLYTEMIISPLIRWPNSLCHYTGLVYSIRRRSDPPSVSPNYNKSTLIPSRTADIECPSCAERVLAKAKKCKHCRSNLPSLSLSALPSPVSKTKTLPTQFLFSLKWLELRARVSYLWEAPKHKLRHPWIYRNKYVVV